MGRQSILVEPFSSLHQKCVAWMLSGRSSLHAPPIPLGSLMVWDDVIVVRKLFMADGAIPVLLDNLAI